MAADSPDDVIYYSITGGDDANKFTIDSMTGEIIPNGPFDYENPNDANTDGVYELILQAQDSFGALASSTLSLTVQNTNEPPIFVSSAVRTFPSAGSGISYNASALDPEAQQVTYSLSTNLDEENFTIDQTSGAVSFLSPPSFAAPTDYNGDNVYEIELIATDSDGLSSDHLVTIEIVDASPVYLEFPDYHLSAGGTETVQGTDLNDTFRYGHDAVANGASLTINGGNGDDQYTFEREFGNGATTVINDTGGYSEFDFDFNAFQGGIGFINNTDNGSYIFDDAAARHGPTRN